jgi:formate--tetrahydrofolate ligase
VLVATVRALKFHGGVDLAALGREDLGALERGLANLERHLHNLREVFGLPCVVAVNHFASDTEAEHALLRERIGRLGVAVHTASHWAEGGRGAVDLAHEVVRLCEQPSTLRFAYEDADPLWDKLQQAGHPHLRRQRHACQRAVRRRSSACRKAATATAGVRGQDAVQLCHRPQLRGAPSGHILTSVKCGWPPAPSSSSWSAAT